MNYLDIANSSLLYIMAAILLLTICFISVLFLVIANKRAKEIGIDSSIIRSTIKSSAVFSIAPSIPIVIALIAMVAVLGRPFSWLRLSIIGSFQYELMTANIGATSMGVNGLGGSGYTPYVFLNSMWIMSLGIIWGIILSITVLKRFSNKLQVSKSKDNVRLQIIITSLYFGMLSVFIGPPIIKGGIELYTLVFSAFTFIFIDNIRKRFKIKWLSDFTFTISMISGMVFASLIGVIL